VTRAQYIALCLIGGVALVAFMESQRVAKALALMMRGGNAAAAGRVGV